MSLNITFDGYVYDKDGNISNSDIKYQAYFYDNGTASSPSTWNDVRTVESTGYYSCNLGDTDWLGQEKIALPNAKVLIVFWKGSPLEDNRNALCNILSEWGTLELTLTGSSVYSQDAQVRDNISPVLQWSHNVPSHGYVNTTYSTTNTSYDVHDWNFNGIATSGTVTMNHWRTRYGEDIQLINTISGTDYYWGDTTSDLGLPAVANSSHQWSSAGVYDIDIEVYDECNDTVSGTSQIEIFNHAPTCDITCNEATGQSIITPDTVVSFNYTGSDVDSTISGIDWVINDTGIYGNTTTVINDVSASGTVYHTNGLGTDWCGHSATSGAFTNPGNHLIEATVHWNDGFSDQILNCNETFNQQKFTGPVINFEQDPPQATVGNGITFNNVTTNISRVGLGLPDCTEYDWRWIDNSVYVDYLDKPYSYELNVTPASASCSVRLCADWSDGWDTQQTCKESDVVFDTTVTITEVECYYNLNVVGTSSDGSVSGYSWDVYRSTSSGIAGPYELMWVSPVGIEQNDKKVCFTEENYFKIVGYVYGTGTTTSGYDNLYVDEVCVSGTAGETEYITIPICQPEMEPDEVGGVSVSIDGLHAPGINTDAITIGAPIMRVFSAPQNL